MKYFKTNQILGKLMREVEFSLDKIDLKIFFNPTLIIIGPDSTKFCPIAFFQLGLALPSKNFRPLLREI